VTLAHLNQCEAVEFVNTLAGIFEHSPWVAEQSVSSRPFDSIDQLHQTMFDAVLNSSNDQQLQLIRNHPELAGKEAESGTLTDESTQEQRGAGLDQCSAEELAQLRELNATYRQRVGFPIVIAVKGLNRYDILGLMQQRIDNNIEQEQQTCIEQIGRIARFRLDDLIDESE
jgi:2-oxo-4-hydroxy-4-carboxy-5-ureidoimidazoline decarboxylase